MVELSYEQLYDSLLASLVPRAGFNPYYFDLYTVYFVTGCRSAEVLDRSRWGSVDEAVVKLVPLKGNNQRLFDAATLPESFIGWINGYNNYFDDLTLRQLEYSFRLVFRYPNAFKGVKKSVLYLFRYRYVKDLSNKGFTFAEITDKMGWHSEGIAASYVNAAIFADI